MIFAKVYGNRNPRTLTENIRTISRSRDIEMPSLIIPQRLSPGDLVGVISPSGPVDEPELQAGLDMIKSSGFEILKGTYLFCRKGYLAGDDEKRLKDLHAMFANRDIKAVFCTRGGYGTMRLLDRINYALIRENPKIIAGFSDITALLTAIHEKTGLITFHGPVLQGLTAGNRACFEGLIHTLTIGEPFNISLGDGYAIVPGAATGHLTGGNLSLICSLIGTPYFPALRGAILFIEEKGESLYRIDRMLTHLLLSGSLNGLAGVVAGEFTGCADMEDINGLLTDRISGLRIPVATGLSTGHGMENITLPIGLSAQLDSGSMTLSIKSACVTG